MGQSVQTSNACLYKLLSLLVPLLLQQQLHMSHDQSPPVSALTEPLTHAAEQLVSQQSPANTIIPT